METTIETGSRTNNPNAVAARIMKATRIKKILVDELGVTDKVQLEHWGDVEWGKVARIDFEREGLKKFRPLSDQSRNAVLALLPPFEGISIVDADEDPFEGLT